MKRRRFRSAITGPFVSREYAEAHPDTTVGETVEEKRDNPQQRDER